MRPKITLTDEKTRKKAEKLGKDIDALKAEVRKNG